jgi:hypothetical protein
LERGERGVANVNRFIRVGCKSAERRKHSADVREIGQRQKRLQAQIRQTTLDE